MRLVVGVLAVLLLAAGCSTGDNGTELAASTSGDGYRSPVWLGDTVYYLAVDSGGAAGLMRAGPGRAPEAVPFANCRAEWLVPAGENRIGVVVDCGGRNHRLVTVDAGGATADPPAPLDYTGEGATWDAVAFTGYTWQGGCGLRSFPGSEGPCFGGPDARYPVIGPDRRVLYLDTRCGTDEPARRGTYAVCRHDSAGETTLARGVATPAGLDARGGRIAVAGTVDGDAGLWLLDAGRFTRVATGDFRGVALSPDGRRAAAPLRDEGWLSTRWSLRVVGLPLS
ncbi:hypothetical protein [Dactylosporangium sp. NPDC049140]|uniref:hypothetical protein n=1 Tax=Dactylosporangium sp. NPDC049140 TaxID=3155647 RepID=UPI0033E475E0